MSIAEDMCNFASFRPATLTVTNFFKQVRLCLPHMGHVSIHPSIHPSILFLSSLFNSQVELKL